MDKVPWWFSGDNTVFLRGRIEMRIYHFRDQTVKHHLLKVAEYQKKNQSRALLIPPHAKTKWDFREQDTKRQKRKAFSKGRSKLNKFFPEAIKSTLKTDKGKKKNPRDLKGRAIRPKPQEKKPFLFVCFQSNQIKFWNSFSIFSFSVKTNITQIPLRGKVREFLPQANAHVPTNQERLNAALNLF